MNYFLHANFFHALKRISLLIKRPWSCPSIPSNLSRLFILSNLNIFLLSLLRLIQEIKCEDLFILFGMFFLLIHFFTFTFSAVLFCCSCILRQLIWSSIYLLLLSHEESFRLLREEVRNTTFHLDIWHRVSFQF